MIALAAVLASVFVTVTAVALFGFLGLSLDRQLKPVELASLFVNVFIAVFLQYFFASRQSTRRVEKDLLIGNISEAIKILRSCRDIFLLVAQKGTKFTKTEQTGLLTSLRNLANELEGAERASGYSSKGLDVQHWEKTQRLLQDYKRVLTGGAFPSKPYPVSIHGEENQAFRALHDQLTSLIFQINRLR